jgi:hypothetical protein
VRPKPLTPFMKEMTEMKSFNETQPDAAFGTTAIVAGSTTSK